MQKLDKQVAEAVKLFWLTRDRQSARQGSVTGQKDAGLRAAVTGGKHLDGFTTICRDLFIDAGVPEAHIHWQKKRELPGYYRAEKSWDLVVVAKGHLLAVIEFKAQVGPSFGNNFNNRTEEALGNATDLWAAYREGAFKPSARPWAAMYSFSKTVRDHVPQSRCSNTFRRLPEFQSVVRQTLRDPAAAFAPVACTTGACLLMTSRRAGCVASSPVRQMS